MLTRMLFQRLAQTVRFLRLFSFQVPKFFMTSQAIKVRELEQALECIDEGRHNDAIAIIQRAIDSDTSNHFLFQLRGLIYTLQSKPDRAIVDLNEAIALNSSDANSYVHRGRAWAALGEYPRAVEDFTTATAADSNAEAYSARGDAYIAIGEYNAALEDYEKVIGLRPDADAYVARGTAYFALKDVSNALKDFNKANLLEPSNTAAHVMRGNIYQGQEHHGAAAEEYGRAIALTPEIANLDELDLMDESTKTHLYELGIQDIGNAYCGRGISRSRMGEIDEALNDFNAAIKLMPENANFYCVRAVAYGEQGEHSRAMQDFEVAVELDNRSASPLFAKAGFHFNSKDFDRSLQDCHRAISLSPDWSEAFCLRGMVLMRLGDYGGAIRDFGETINLGSGSSSIGNEQNRGMSMTPDLGRPVAYAYRGLAYLLLGSESMGREDIVKSLESGYSQSEIEKEIADILPEGSDRTAIEDIVKSVVEDGRNKSTKDLRRTASKARTSRCSTKPDVVAPWSASTKPRTLSVEEYTSLFQRLGLYDVKVGRTLKHREPIPSIYFNCRYGAVFFVAYRKDEPRYHRDLWDQIPPQKRRDAKHNLITILPRSGKEHDAFSQLLGGDVADRKVGVMQQQQASASEQQTSGRRADSFRAAAKSAVEGTKRLGRELHMSYTPQRALHKMTLIADGNVIANQPDASAVRAALQNMVEKDEGDFHFVILESGPGYFIQTAYSPAYDDASQEELVLEVREGSARQHSRCVNISSGPEGLEEVVRAFTSYLHGEEDWDCQYDWGPLL